MWNRPLLFLWVSVNISAGRHIHIAFPLFLPILYMLVDMLDDLYRLADFISFHGLSRSIRDKSWFGWAGFGFCVLRGITAELVFHTEPQELVRVDCGGDGRVKVVCRLI